MEHFAHLHCHSFYSFYSGTISPTRLVQIAVANNMPAIALTDHNGMYGAIQFYKKAKETGLKPILGVELVLDKKNKSSTVLLAKDYYGYTQLCELVSDFNLNKEFSLFSSLEKLYEAGKRKDNDCHFIILTNDPVVANTVCRYINQNHLYIEINPGVSEKILSLVNLAEAINRKVIITGNIYFEKRKDYVMHKLLRTIAEHRTLSSNRYDFIATPENYFKTANEVSKLSAFPRSLLAPVTSIIEMCNVVLPMNGYKFPKFNDTEGLQSSIFLKNICEQEAAIRYKVKNYKSLPAPVSDRIKYELQVINELGFTDYFLFVWDIVQYAKKKSIPLIGRGSAANSIISYILGVTDVEPLSNNLYFERFLNLERKNPPDIDIDFCWKRREEVLNYVYQKYGFDRVAMISTHVKFMGRSLIREIGKAMGLPERYLNGICSRLPYFFNGNQITEVIEKIPECRTLPINQEPLKTILQYAANINGFPRHLSIHPGGIVISPTKITNFVPLEKATKGLVITQYDMFSVEDIGLIKIDLLSQRSLSVYSDTLKTVKELYSETAEDDLDKIYQNEQTKALIRKGETIGCFYIESPAMRQLLKKLKVDTFPMLTAASSVIRPGVAESGMMQQYIRRHLKIEPVSYLHPKMKQMLKDTYGVMIYQEDVLRVAHEIIGLSLGEADLLRKAMSGKERSQEKMLKLRKKFLQTAISNGIKNTAANEIWRQIESFAGYAFCKAHSASYAQLSFKVAYLKTHYPAEFMAAVLSNQGGFYHPSVYVSEARRMNLHILPVNVNKSNYQYTTEKYTHPEYPDQIQQNRNNAIRIGFIQVKNLSYKTIDNILKERQKGLFTSLENFLYRVDISYSEAYILTKLGAMQFSNANLLNDNRRKKLTTPQMLWKLKAIYPTINNLKGKQNHSILKEIPLYQEIPDIKEYSIKEKVKIEEDYLGMAITVHPLELCIQEIQDNECVSSSDFWQYKGQIIYCVGWLTALKRVVTSKCKYMLFLSFEDLNGFYETVLFPTIYAKYGTSLTDRGPYIIKGEVVDDFGSVSINVIAIKHL